MAKAQRAQYIRIHVRLTFCASQRNSGTKLPDEEENFHRPKSTGFGAQAGLTMRGWLGAARLDSYHAQFKELGVEEVAGAHHTLSTLRSTTDCFFGFVDFADVSDEDLNDMGMKKIGVVCCVCLVSATIDLTIYTLLYNGRKKSISQGFAVCVTV